jgi:hypothetical protein
LTAPLAVRSFLVIAFLRLNPPCPRPEQIKFKQLRQRVRFGNIRRPAIGGSDGGVEIAVRISRAARTAVFQPA